MKIIFSLLIFISLTSLSKINSGASTHCVVQKHYHSQADSLNWLQSFNDFRTAVYSSDINKVKSFFNFPIVDDNNEIWQLVYQGNENERGELSAKKPFTAQDFEKHFNGLFSKKFRNAIVKLHSGDLGKKGESETSAFKENNTTTYKMYATVDKIEKTLTLSLAFRTVLKDEKGKVEGSEEYGTLYVFDMLSNGQIKFKGIRLTA